MVIGSKMCYTGSESKLARWCKVFTSKTEEEFKEAVGECMMEEEAREKLEEEVNKYSRDDEVIALYSKYTRQELEHNTFMEDAREEGLRKGLEEGRQLGIKQGIEQGRQEGLEQGLEQGKQERNIEIAKNMLNEKIDVPTIMRITGFTKKQIEELK